MMTDSESFISIRNDLQEALNRHGYAFQFSVLKKAQAAYDDRRISRWRFEAAELPVRTESRDTRIDFVLSRHREDARMQWYLICECKRVNPSRGNWCFLRAPFIHRSREMGFQRLLIECVERWQGEMQASGHPGNAVDAYGVGLAIRESEPGDKAGKRDDDAIEDAASQVLRGVNGFANTLHTHPHLLRWGNETAAALLIPAIFTTAKLWVSDADISSASINDGKIDLSATSFEPKPWLWFAYHASPGLRHSLKRRTFSPTIHNLMDDDYIRHIAVVSTDGIEQFLRRYSDTDSFI